MLHWPAMEGPDALLVASNLLHFRGGHWQQSALAGDQGQKGAPWLTPRPNWVGVMCALLA